MEIGLKVTARAGELILGKKKNVFIVCHYFVFILLFRWNENANLLKLNFNTT